MSIRQINGIAEAGVEDDGPANTEGSGNGVSVVVENDTFASTEVFNNAVRLLPGGVIVSLSVPVRASVPSSPTAVAVVAAGGSVSLKAPVPSKSALIRQGIETGTVEPAGTTGDSVASMWSCKDIVPLTRPA